MTLTTGGKEKVDILEPHDFQKWVWKTVSICILQLWEDRATLRLTVYGQLRHFSHIFTRFTPGCFWKGKNNASPPGADADRLQPSSHLLPVRHEKLSLSDCLTNLQQKPCWQKHFVFCELYSFALAGQWLKWSQRRGDMCWVCRLTSFMTPVFVPPDNTQAFVALAAPIRPAWVFLLIAPFTFV